MFAVELLRIMVLKNSFCLSAIDVQVNSFAFLFQTILDYL